MGLWDSYVTLRTAHEFCANRKGGIGGGAWGHLEGAVHMVGGI